MTVYELIQRLAQFPPGAEVEVVRSFAFKRPMRVLSVTRKMNEDYRGRTISDKEIVLVITDWKETT